MTTTALRRRMGMGRDAEHAADASLIEHLVELGARPLRAVAGLMRACLALLPFANRLYAWLAPPLLEKLPEGAHLIAVEVASPFFAPLKLAFFVALSGTMPWL